MRRIWAASVRSKAKTTIFAMMHLRGQGPGILDKGNIAFLECDLPLKRQLGTGVDITLQDRTYLVIASGGRVVIWKNGVFLLEFQKAIDVTDCKPLREQSDEFLCAVRRHDRFSFS